MPMIPICLKPDETRPCLVVGGGRIALRKARWLLECGARVEVISPGFESELEALARESPDKVTLKREAFGSSDPAGVLGRYQLVIAATDEASVNQAVAQAARQASVPVNVVDQPELCTFYVPAVVQRGNLQLTVSTSGAAPSLAARIRGELEAQYPGWLETYLKALGMVRREILERGMETAQRHELLNYMASREVAEQLKGLDLERSVEHLRQIAKSWLDLAKNKPQKKP